MIARLAHKGFEGIAHLWPNACVFVSLVHRGVVGQNVTGLWKRPNTEKEAVVISVKEEIYSEYRTAQICHYYYYMVARQTDVQL